MKLTLSISLGGYSFNIDEDGYDELKKYIKDLEYHFAGNENCPEILADIEARIAEIFKAGLTPFKQTVSLNDVKQAISAIGIDVSGDEQKTSGGKFQPSGSRRIYRDPDNRVIGGVCAGIGACWSISPIIIRIIFILLVFGWGLGVFIYLLLYITIPEAQTAAQKIEMHGEPVNLQNIKDTVKKEFNAIRKRLNL